MAPPFLYHFELLGSTLSLTPSPQLARLYGVAPWDGVSEPPQLPKNERAGLLTRAAFLVTGDHGRHHVRPNENRDARRS